MDIAEILREAQVTRSLVYMHEGEGSERTLKLILQWTGKHWIVWSEGETMKLTRAGLEPTQETVQDNLEWLSIPYRKFRNCMLGRKIAVSEDQEPVSHDVVVTV